MNLGRIGSKHASANGIRSSYHSTSSCEKRDMRGLRVLHVIEHFYPSLGYQETFLARKHGRSNTTLMMTSDRYSRGIFNASKSLLKKRKVGTGYFTENGINVLRLPALFDIPPFENPWLLGLERAIINFKPDIIIVHGIVSLASIQVAKAKAKLTSSKLVLDDHMALNATRGGWTYLIYWVFKKTVTPILLRSACVFVAVARESKHFMETKYGIPSSRIKIIPLGADREMFKSNVSNRLFIRKKYAITDSEVVFLYVGKLIPEKGTHLLVQAGISLCKKHSNVRIMLVGGGSSSYIGELRARIERSDLRYRFIFVEPLPNQELPKYYSAGDVGVWPLQASISMIEAASCGLPIIISDGSRAVERVGEGNGMLYRERDVIDLERKMEELLDERLRKTMARKAENYAAKHDWEEISKSFLELAREDL